VETVSLRTRSWRVDSLWQPFQRVISFCHHILLSGTDTGEPAKREICPFHQESSGGCRKDEDRPEMELGQDL